MLENIVNGMYLQLHWEINIISAIFRKICIASLKQPLGFEII